MDNIFDDLFNDQDRCLYEMSAPVAPTATFVIPTAPVVGLANSVATNREEPQPATRCVSKKYFCQICDEPASKYSYGAVSCNACRQFFKRVVFKNLADKMQTCQNGGNCKVTSVSRNECKKCRYDRCLYFGMRPELVTRARNIYDNKT